MRLRKLAVRPFEFVDGVELGEISEGDFQDIADFFADIHAAARYQDPTDFGEHGPPVWNVVNDAEVEYGIVGRIRGVDGANVSDPYTGPCTVPRRPFSRLLHHARIEIERVNRDLPQIQIVTIIDSSDYIKRSITNVGTTVLYGSGLAILVLLLFLRNIPSTAIMVPKYFILFLLLTRW